MSKRDELIREMIDTFEGLGHTPTARIDARVWAMFYRRKHRKILRRLKSPVDRRD